jgi:hypothetical protein
MPSAQDPACSFTHTNRNCILTLDRNSFVFPAPLQMSPRSVVTVRIRYGNDFEMYTLDPAPGQATILPDVTSTVLGNLSTILAAASSLGAVSTSAVPQAQPAVKTLEVDPCKKNPKGEECQKIKAEELKQPAIDNLKLLQDATDKILAASLPSKNVYGELQALLTPDAQPPLVQVPPPVVSKTHIKLEDLLRELCGASTDLGSYQPCARHGTDGLLYRQAAASAYAAAVLAGITKSLSSVDIPSMETYQPLITDVLNAMQLVNEEQAALDSIRKDLEGYAARIQDLIGHPTMVEGTVGYIQDSGISRHVSRAVNYSLNRLNLVTNSQEAANDGSKKALIVTIAVVYGDSHWEASSGIAFAFRPIRTFTVAPVVANGSQTYISEAKAGPEVVPFATADYRLGDDFKLLGWRGAFYATGGVGYNISQETADFLVGPSLAWRGLLLSALCDFGHGAHLGQGLMVGDQLGTSTTPTSVTTLPTTNYWVPAFTIGISVRIPGVPGR